MATKKLNVNTSVVDYLKSVGGDSSFSARADLAVKLGIVDKKSDYKGTAQQNTSLLKAAKTDTGTSSAKAATATANKSSSTANKSSSQAPTNSGKVANKVQSNVTTGVNSTGTEVIDNLTQLISAAMPTGGQYDYDPVQQMQAVDPRLMSSAELAKLYGLDYNLGNMEATLLDALNAGYDARYAQQDVVEDKYYDNAATAQSTLMDALRQQQSQAVLAGTSKGMQAAQALSAMLGTSQQFAGQATQLAQDRQLMAKEFAADRAKTGVDALNMYNTMGQQLADVSKNVYSSDISKYVGQLDYNASAVTANAQLGSQAMAAKSQWETNYANSIANAYRSYYDGQITLEQAKMQADAAVKSAQVYGLDASRVNAEANKQIANINAGASNYNADRNFAATTQAANLNSSTSKEIAQMQLDAQNNNKGNGADLVTGIIAGVNAGTIKGKDAQSALAGYKAAGLIDDTVYTSTLDAIGYNRAAALPSNIMNGLLGNPSNKVDGVSGAAPISPKAPDTSATGGYTLDPFKSTSPYAPPYIPRK